MRRLNLQCFAQNSLYQPANEKLELMRETSALSSHRPRDASFRSDSHSRNKLEKNIGPATFVTMVETIQDHVTQPDSPLVSPK